MLARNLRAALAAGTALSLAFAASPAAAQLVNSGDLVDAIDSGGNGGQLTIVDTTATQTDMTVLAPVVVANWVRFNVPTGTTVNIAPDAALAQATLVNRVIGATSSDISGTINAADVNLWLINQNGILFGDGAAINSASFFGSTLDVSDADLFDFYQGTNLAGNGSSNLRFSGSLGNAIATSSPNVNFVTDGTVLFVSEQLNLDATVSAGTGNVAFVAASDVNVSFTPGSPLSYVINAGTTVADAMTIGGSVSGGSIDFQMISAAGVVNALLRVDADLNATTALATDTGIRLFANQAGSASVTVEIDGVASATGRIDLRTDGSLTATSPITGSGVFAQGITGLTLDDVTATNGSVQFSTSGSVLAGDVSATGGGISFAASNSGSATFSSLVASGGNVTIAGLVPGSIAVTGLTQGNSVDLISVNGITLGNVNATIGGVNLNAQNGALTAGNVGAATSVSLFGRSIAAGNVTAGSGPSRLLAADGISATSITSLAGSIDVDSTGGGALNLGALDAELGITLDTTGGITAGSITAGGALTVGGTTEPSTVTFTGNASAGSVTVDVTGAFTGQSVTATAGGVDIDADSINAGNIAATGGNIVLVSANTLGVLDVTANSGTVQLSAGLNLSAEDVLASGDIRFAASNSGSASFASLISTGGGVFVNGAIPGIISVSGAVQGTRVDLFALNAIDVGDVTATAGGAALQTLNGTISAEDVSATGGNAILFAPGAITTTSITARAAGGLGGAIDVDSTNGGNLSLGNLASDNTISLDTTGSITTGAITTLGRLNVGAFQSPTSATFNGSVSANELFARVSGLLTFGAVNQINTITGLRTGGALSLENATGNLAIAGLVTAGTNDVTIRNSGDVTISVGGQVVGGLVALSTGDQFINLRGSDAITAGNRWAIYSAAPAGNTFGNLDSGNTAIWNGTIDTVAPGSLSGNRYVFAFQPTLTVTSTDSSKVYGTDLTGSLDSFFTASGFQEGIAGAYLGDTLAGILSGTPSITSLGAVANADVLDGPYALNVSQGSLVAANGYALAFDSSGRLTITPKAITASVSVNNKTYDGNRTGTGTVTLDGVVTGDTVGTSGTTFTFADKNAGTGKTVAIAGTTLTGADAGNYTLTVPASALADILARVLIVTADSKEKTQGTPDPALTFQIGGDGLVAGEAISGSLSREVGELLGEYAITRGTLNAGNNYTIRFEGGTLTIQPPPFGQVPLRSQALPGDIPGTAATISIYIDASGVCSQEDAATCQVAR